MQHGANIGATVVIKGDISAKEPLTVSGRVEGTIDVRGHVVRIEAGAHVTGDVTASGIVVAGTLKGALVAEERITLGAGADVEGTLNAPRLAVEDGACVNGKATVVRPGAVDLARAS